MRVCNVFISVANEDHNSAVEMAPLDEVDASHGKKKVCIVFCLLLLGVDVQCGVVFSSNILIICTILAHCIFLIIMGKDITR